MDSVSLIYFAFQNVHKKHSMIKEYVICSSKNCCLQCIDGHALTPTGSCASHHPDGTYNFNGFCSSCSSNCIKCPNDVGCDLCDSHSYLWKKLYFITFC